MRKTTFPLLCVLFSVTAVAAEPPAAPKFVKPLTINQAPGGKMQVEFALDAGTDVEVVVLDAEGEVVRHLAAGVLGAKNRPPPPLRPGLAQSIQWDGRDDYRQPAEKGPFTVGVRAGMSVKLEQIAGGDPYLYFIGGHGDHNRWGLTGLERKSDGKVYVVGRSSTIGPAAIRQYDADGNYLRTVFPPPAGKDPEAVEGWGIHVKTDGTYALRFTRLTDVSVGTTIVDRTLDIARLMPTADPNRLSLWLNLQMLTINTDGTIPPSDEQTKEWLVQDPPIRTDTTSAAGPVFTCLSPDGKFFYLSGVYGCTGKQREPVRDGFWLDGQVWKVDLATRKATPLFALDRKAVIESLTTRMAKASESSLGGIHSYSALHGVAVDKNGHVFVADRLDRCVLVLDEDAEIIRRVPVDYPDAVAVSARTGALYVTTRFGCERSGQGKMGLVKFDDWQKDDEPSVSLPDLAHTWYTDGYKHSHVVLCEKPECTNVWVAYTELPVHIYADDGKYFKLLKDFHQLGAEQGCSGFDRVAVDRRTDTVYIGDNHSTFWKISDWKQPQFVKLPLKAASVAIDPRNRFIFANPGGSVWQKHGIARHHLDRKDCPPANVGDTGTNVVTERLWTEWCFTGNSDIGFDVAPNGDLAGLDQRGRLHFFHGTQQKAPWESLELADVKASGAFGCVQFDLAGNLYVGCRDGKPWKVPPVFRGDRFAGQDGGAGCTKIVKYAPTGTLESGNLFPTAPQVPCAVYEVNFGAFDASCVLQTPRFSVDEFGRIYYPTSIEPRVTVMDNAGNEILHFGTWGNRDSTGGLPGDLVPTRDVPMGLPNSVAATDDYIYVADMVNLRILRIKKNYALQASSNGE